MSSRADLIADARRLTTPRPIEPDYKKHLARIRGDRAALKRLAAAGYTGGRIDELASAAAEDPQAGVVG